MPRAVPPLLPANVPMAPAEVPHWKRRHQWKLTTVSGKCLATRGLLLAAWRKLPPTQIKVLRWI